MFHQLNKRDIDILEERGLWKASSFLHKIVKRVIRKNAPLRVRYIVEDHRIIFTTANQTGMAGKYRKDNPELKRMDGSLLKLKHWRDVPNAMSELDFELRDATKNTKQLKTPEEYYKVINSAVILSHHLACIHPFENGNGRSSRLLLNAILLRAGLPEIAIKKKKSQYLRAMLQADKSDFSMLENMVMRGVLDNKERQYKIVRSKQTELAKHRPRAKA